MTIHPTTSDSSLGQFVGDAFPLLPLLEVILDIIPMTQRLLHQTHSVSRTQIYGPTSSCNTTSTCITTTTTTTTTANNVLKPHHQYEMTYVEPVAARPSTAPLFSSTNLAMMGSPVSNSKRSAPKDDLGECSSDEGGGI